MLIHKGDRYTIALEGDTVRKSDGKGEITMPYYPERDATGIAGEIDELTAWEILRDVAGQAEGADTPVSPEHILIDGPRFILNPHSRSQDRRYMAPAGYDPVWALGASIFYIFLGCDVFQGRGGKGETATTPVPVLRRELPELSRLVADCLAFDPGKRPSLKTIAETAEKNILRCRENLSEFPPVRLNEGEDPKIMKISDDDLERWWPEEMK